jgi:hypothetical protein
MKGHISRKSEHKDTVQKLRLPETHRISDSPAMTDLVGRPVKKGSILILQKNRPVQQICESNKIDQAVQFIFT